jgi:hypothetical protein
METPLRRPAATVVRKWGIWGPIDVIIVVGGNDKQLIDITSPMDGVWHCVHHPK